MVFPLAPSDGVFPGAMTANTMLIGMSCAPSIAIFAANTLTMKAGLYTLANSTQLGLLNSASTTMGTGAFGGSNSSLFLGPRQIRLLTGQWSSLPVLTRTHYWLGLQFFSSGSALALSVSGFRWMESANSGFIGVGSSSILAFPGCGVFSASFSSALPSTLGFADLRSPNALAGKIPTIVIHNIGA